MKIFKYELGQQVKCTITGFKGTIVGRTEFINGCKQYVIQPKCSKENMFVDEQCIDEQSLELIPVKKKTVKKSDVGGPSRPVKMRGY